MSALRTLSKIGNENRTDYKKAPKVKRYWPGKAPEWAPKAQEDDELLKEQEEADRGVGGGRVNAQAQQQTQAKARELIAAAQRDRDAKEQVNKSKEESSDSESDSDDEAALAARRARMRARAQAREEEEAAADELAKADSSSSEYESVYETDSEEEKDAPILFQPVFRKKADRDTVAEREAVDAEFDRMEERRLARQAERAAETRDIVREEVQRDDDIEAGRALGSDDEMPADNDGVDEDEEFEAWKLRELRRLKRDKTEREEEDLEQADIERRRNMTDAERAAEDAKNKKGEKLGAKGDMKYMQKYYHKGAFFQDEAEKDKDHIYNRNYQEATGFDKEDIKQLPKIMQVRNFGLRGRSKYTHLKDQDTTSFDSAWNQAEKDPRNIGRHNYDKQMGGMGSNLNRPSRRGNRGKDELDKPTQQKR